MRVLLTGHEGYLGAVVARVLREAGHEVVGLDTGYFVGCDLGPASEAVDTVAVDVRDVAPAQLEGIDAVVHLAGLSNDPLGSLAPELTHAINVNGSARLATAARDAGVRRFVFSSSCSIYGASGADDLVGELAPLRPVTPYAESKVVVEELLHDLSRDDFCTVSLRNATVYGYSPRLRTDLVVNDLVATALLEGRVRVLSDGTPWRPVVHAEDLARVVRGTLEAPVPAVNGEAINVGRSEANHQVRDLAEIVGGELGVRIEITGERGPDPRSYRVDFSKLETLLPDVVLTWDVAAGVRELADAYRAFGLTLDSSRSVFNRVARLTELREVGALDADLRWSDRHAVRR
ncbi:MAG TPA: SDR family oxidoreductase [Acidimicrobiia bacterium]